MFHIDREVLPLGFHPVPIYSVDKECDDLLYAYKNCPRLASLLMQTKDSPEWKKKTDQHSSTLNYLTEVLGAPFSLKEVTTLLNLLNAERIHNNTKTEIKPEIMQELHEIAEWVVNPQEFFHIFIIKLRIFVLHSTEENFTPERWEF